MITDIKKTHDGVNFIVEEFDIANTDGELVTVYQAYIGPDAVTPISYSESFCTMRAIHFINTHRTFFN